MKFWHDKNVLITGNTGFKGSWLTLWLKEIGANVYGYSLAPETNPNMYKSCNLDKNLTTYISDIYDFKKLKLCITKTQPEIIFHMAAQPLVIESYLKPYYTLNTNIVGTYNLLESIREIDSIKVLINITTDKVYENTENNHAFKETDKLGGDDIYSVSKACSDLITSSYKKSFFTNEKDNIAISTARSGNVIGGGDWASNRLVPDIVKSVNKNELVKIRNPQSTRPWQHVIEPLYGYILLAEQMYANDPNVFSSGWNFGPSSKQEESVSSVSQKLLKLYGKNDLYSPSSESYIFKESELLKLDCTKSEKYLSWKSNLTIDETLSLTHEWYASYYNSENMYDVTYNQIKSYMDKL